jgi:hypothetical protein
LKRDLQIRLYSKISFCDLVQSLTNIKIINKNIITIRFVICLTIWNKRDYSCVSIKFGTPHEQCPAHRPVPSIDEDVRGLAAVVPW